MVSIEAVEGREGTSSALIPQKKDFKNTVSFICDERVSSVSMDKRVQIPIKRKEQTQEEWERMWFITGQYLGTDKTLEEIGDNFGITRERVRQIVKKGVGQLYQIQSPQVQDEFPLEQFDYRKPWATVLRRRESTAKGGKTVRAEQLFLEGKTPQQIKEELGLQDLSHVRDTLRKWGIEVRYEINFVSLRFKKLKDPELADEEKQKLLDGVKYSRVHNVLSSGERPLIVAVSKVGKQAGLFFRVDKTNIIYSILRSNGVPASSFPHMVRINKKGELSPWNYCFICATDIGRAIEVIRNASELDHFRKNPV